MSESNSNIVDIYSFKESLERSISLKKLHKMLKDFKIEEEKILSENDLTKRAQQDTKRSQQDKKRSQQDNRSYYMNSTFRNILSSTALIKTLAKDETE